MKFLLYSYKYDWRVGGIVVLNKLADVLADIGFETYIIGEDNEINGKAVRVSEVQAIEGIGHLTGAPCNFAVVGAVDIALHPAGNHFAFAMVALREIDQSGDQQLLALHQT